MVRTESTERLNHFSSPRPGLGERSWRNINDLKSSGMIQKIFRVSFLEILGQSENITIGTDFSALPQGQDPPRLRSGPWQDPIAIGNWERLPKKT